MISTLNDWLNNGGCFSVTYNAPINVFPHHPPLGPKWGFTGGIDTKLLPHYGAFDTSIDSIFDISIDTSIDISIFDILCLPHCGEFDIRVCQIPTIAPYNPEGGVVGEYIDRCIIALAVDVIDWRGPRN